ncbi:cytochrome c biogenesis protein CcmG, thiol:disulfide interchange protein DsbE [Jannaschia faecimaris]|uniref:Cytochrome c biogenesis protein CcmG, thiol:disulfide interchange protein DsbE n=1 Tax=Jannaschia faecimaris TaxID=1244108 RepID=A0A1H3QLG7_9RHOB|nr:DsbE family thiol:disulfide interchange protein [Jannaschia faecimaris]SDZ14236.1 cytochrome c biogenesis protein CcmG, thiol:disulfide interchange protein DsbE [Jannaschia faecimaris]
MRWLALVPVALFALLAGFFLSGLFRDNPDDLPSAFIGQEAPALNTTELPTRTPLPADLMSDREVKLVNFWASWCVPCRVEHPQIETLSEVVPVYGVNHKDQPANAIKFLEELGDPYAAIGVDGGRVAIDWGVTGFPETFVIDGDGIVRLRFAGPITVSVMNDTILPAIEAAQAN